MALRNLFRRTVRARAAATPVPVGNASVHLPTSASRQGELNFVLREFETTADDGAILYGRGWVIHDEDDRGVPEADPRLDNAGILIFNVAGVTFRPQALQESCFNPGHEVQLV